MQAEQLLPRSTRMDFNDTLDEAALPRRGTCMGWEVQRTEAVRRQNAATRSAPTGCRQDLAKRKRPPHVMPRSPGPRNGVVAAAPR